MESCTLQSKLEKITKIHPKKTSYIPEKWNFLTLILKNFLYFLKRKLFLYFRKWKPPKFSYIFLKKCFSYISGSGNLKKIPYISGNGTFLYFRKRKP